MSPASASTLADPQQIIADLRRELAEARRKLDERTAERDEAMEQQTATAEVLGVINSSPGDLTPVFDSMLEKALRLCDAAFGNLWTYDGEIGRLAAIRGASPEYRAELMRAGPQKPEPGGSLIRLVVGEPLVHIADITADRAHRSGNAVRRMLADRAGARTVLWVPLRKDGALLGFFAIYRTEVRPFSDKQIALLQNFAAQAVIAMENARLITETREALEQQTATAEVLGVINASPGALAPVFDAILEKAHSLCDIAQGSLELYDGERFKAVAVRGLSDAFAAILRQGYPASDNPATRPLMEGERFSYIANMMEADYSIERTAAETEAVRTLLCVPLRQESQLLGMIASARKEVRPFSDKEIALLENFAAQAVIAMENARLLSELRQRTSDLEESLGYQTATSDLLKLISRSTFDLEPVLGTLVETAVRLCGADSGHLTLPDGEDYRTAAAFAMTPELEAITRENSFRPGRGTAIGRALTDQRVVQIEDIGADPEHAIRQAAVLGLVRTVLAVPLLREGEPIGALGLARSRIERFSDRQIELVRTFADQAVIAIENTRLITETREALEQQTATAEVLQVINSSPGDLQPVFDAMLEKAMRLCGAAFGYFMSYDGEKFESIALRGVPREFAEWLNREPLRPGPLTGLGRIARGAPLIHIPDLIADEAYRLGDPVRIATVELGGARTWLGVPLSKDERLLGVLMAYRQETRPFGDKQIALLQNFAAQAVIAMENARLITETREALEQQTATAEVLGVINSSPGDLAPVFDAMLEKAMRLCEAETAHLLRYENEVFSRIASRGVPEDFDKILPLNTPVPHIITRDSIPYRMVATRAVVHVHDSGEDESVRAGAPDQTAAAASGIRTALFVPLLKEGDVVGGFVMHRMEVRPFADKQIALLQNFAAQAVIAMENARLLDELRQRTEEVAELNRGLEARVAEQVDELGRVGRLKRFLAPQLAELIVSQGDEQILESHRREIVVVFCDLRGYTAFTETAEPEEVLEFLRQYHGALGPLVSQFEGTLDQFSGDGIMVFFNDPVPCPDPAERAVKMAVAMREAARELIAAWSRHGCELGFGVGIAQGFATLGQIGFPERSGYTAIGTVCNLAARLCAEAKDGQILISSRIAGAVEAVARLEDLGNLELKGLRRPVAAFNVAQSTGPAEARPNLTVVARDTGV